MSELSFYTYTPRSVGDRAERIRVRKNESWNKYLDKFLAEYRLESDNRIQWDSVEDFFKNEL